MREVADQGRGGRPRRPVPSDFAATWPTLGWEEAREVYRCDPRTLARWIDETGRDGLILARKRFRDAQRAIRYRAQRKQYRMPVDTLSTMES